MFRLGRAVRSSVKQPSSRWVHVATVVFAAFVLMSAGSSGVAVSVGSVFLVLFWLAAADLVACAGIAAVRRVLNH